MRHSRRLAYTAAAAFCLAMAPRAPGAERRWGGSIGLGLSDVRYPRYRQPGARFEAVAALQEQGRALTATVAWRRGLVGPLRIGLRGSYLRLGTSWVQYCRVSVLGVSCADIATPARIHVVPLAPTLEAEWRPRSRLAVSVGGGYGPALIKRVPDRSDPRAHTEPGHSDLEASPTVFAACELGGSRARARLEVGWRRLGRIDTFSSAHPTPITTWEGGVRLSFGK